MAHKTTRALLLLLPLLLHATVCHASDYYDLYDYEYSYGDERYSYNDGEAKKREHEGDDALQIANHVADIGSSIGLPAQTPGEAAGGVVDQRVDGHTTTTTTSATSTHHPLPLPPTPQTSPQYQPPVTLTLPQPPTPPPMPATGHHQCNKIASHYGRGMDHYGRAIDAYVAFLERYPAQ